MHGNTVWTPEKREEAITRICEAIASGMSLTRSLQMLNDVPAPITFWGWMNNDEALAAKVARAREAGVEVIMEEVRDIADTPQEGEIITETKDGIFTKREDMLGHRKLRIETRFKYAQMVAPRKYGPKIDLTSGGDKLPSTDPGDVATRVAGLLATARERKEKDDG